MIFPDVDDTSDVLSVDKNKDISDNDASDVLSEIMIEIH